MKCLKCLTQKRRRFSWKLFSYVIFVVWNSHDIFCKNFNCQRGLFNSLLFSKQPALHTETWVYNKLKLEYDNFASKWASCCENRSIVIDQKFSLLVKTKNEVFVDLFYTLKELDCRKWLFLTFLYFLRTLDWKN